MEFSNLEANASRHLKIVVSSLLGTSLGFVWVVSNCFFNFETCASADLQVSILAASLGPLTLIMATLVLLHLMISLQVAAEAMTQIKTAIILEERQCYLTGQTLKNLKQIVRLVYLLRKQCKLLDAMGGPPQLVLCGFFFSSAITNWIMLLSLMRGEIPKTTTFTTLMFLTVQVLAYLHHVGILEKLVEEEKNVVDAVIEKRVNSIYGHIEVK